MDTTLKLADLLIHLVTPFSYKNLKQFEPFHQLLTDKADIEVRFEVVDKPIVWEDKPTVGDFYLPKVLLSNGHRYIGYHTGGNRCHAWMESDGNNIHIYYLKDSLKHFPTERQVFGVICLEDLLNRHHGFILHSSFIRWNDIGIVFTAPSGTGKSTQADLWEKYEHAEILNGDRTALRCIDGVWKAYGLPYAGSSDIYRNESALLKCIVVLKQAKENSLELLKGKRAYLAIYSGLTLHPWDEEFMNRALFDLDDLLNKIPIYQLSCRPDKDAVELLKKEMEVLTNGL